MATTTILGAVYGTTTTGFNVTNNIGPGITSFVVNDNTFPDPAPGVVKSFGVLYTDPNLNNGNPIALACQENTAINLLPNPATATTSLQPPLAPAGTVKVLQAVYGTKSNGNDVTAICQALVNQGNFTIPVNNAVLGPDPDFGVVKSFGIIYTSSQGPRQLACQENTNLSLVNVP